MTYRPVPIDTSDVSLSDSLNRIAEQLAANNHDVRALQRIREGWSYGPERNDHSQQMSCLVQYDELPESEKEYDRRATTQTLKAICKLGFQIVDPKTKRENGTGKAFLRLREKQPVSHSPEGNDPHGKTGDTPPSVMVFSGHMIDHPSREGHRFPAEMEESVRVRIRKKIRKHNGGIGYCAAASGSDILFLEEMLGLGGEINIILPIGIDDFKEQSVAAAGEQWLDRFDRVIERAASVRVLDHYTRASFYNSLEYCNYCMFGLARLRAEQTGAEVYPLAVFDPVQPGGGLGGTASVIEAWRRQHVDFSLILLSASSVSEELNNELLLDLPLDIPGCDKTQHHLFLPMLHAAVRNDDKAAASVKICITNDFLTRIAPILDGFQEQILWKQTTDGKLFIICRDIDSAIKLARQLCGTMDTDRDSDADPEIRVVLDAAPCYSSYDPVMKQTRYFGRHIERGISMNPVVSPGSVYASDTFAALCRAFGIKDVSFDHPSHAIL